jgi:hypothetical protein
MCTACPSGTYSASAATINCSACSPNSNSLTQSSTSTACTCNAGYTGADGTGEAGTAGGFVHGTADYEIARFRFVGPAAGHEPIRLGIFAGVHGDEPAGCHALVRFLTALAAEPGRAAGYDLTVYPVVNPTGFEDRTRANRSGGARRRGLAMDRSRRASRSGGASRSGDASRSGNAIRRGRQAQAQRP